MERDGKEEGKRDKERKEINCTEREKDKWREREKVKLRGHKR